MRRDIIIYATRHTNMGNDSVVGSSAFATREGIHVQTCDATLLDATLLDMQHDTLIWDMTQLSDQVHLLLMERCLEKDLPENLLRKSWTKGVTKKSKILQVYKYMFIYIYVCVRACTSSKRICIAMWGRFGVVPTTMSMCIYTYMYVYLYVYIYLGSFICTHVRIYTGVYVHV